MNRTPQVALSWNGLPQYAARLMRAAIDRLDEDCVVVGSKPDVPVAGMEEALGCDVHWVNEKHTTSWQELGLDIPSIFVQSGWSYPAFTALGHEVKANGGKVIGLSDANWRGDFRQLALGPLGFRVRHLKYFDAIIVPGRQGRRLMRYFGMQDCKIRCGMYGADPALFAGGAALTERPKTILYVGQFIDRKNVLGLSKAFLKFHETHPDWTLHLCGSGPQRQDLPKHSNIVIEDFVQPELLVQRYRAARFFVLPSLVEAWGLVVHEAALCGCGLILSDAIGSGDDLAGAQNAVRFTAGREADLVRALRDAAAFTARQFTAAEAQSRQLAAQFGPDRFATELCGLIKEVS